MGCKPSDNYNKRPNSMVFDFEKMDIDKLNLANLIGKVIESFSITLENLISLTTPSSRPHSPHSPGHCPPDLLRTTRCWLLCWLCVGVCISPALLISCAAQQLTSEPAAGSSDPASAGWRLPGLPSPAQPSPAQTSPAVTSLAA